MSRARKIDVSVETVSTSRLVGYGVESTRLNFDMNTDVPSYGPYEDLQCNVTNGVNDLTNKDYQVEDFDHGLSNIDDEDMPNTDSYHELRVPRDSGNALIQNVSQSGFEAFMERMKARDHQTMKILQHDVEHRSIVNLLKILEDSQCPIRQVVGPTTWRIANKLDGEGTFDEAGEPNRPEVESGGHHVYSKEDLPPSTVSKRTRMAALDKSMCRKYSY